MIRQLIIATVVFMQIMGQGRRVDLRNQGLRAVPTNIPSTTESLDLSKNLLKTIPNDSFINLSSLTTLDLSSNQLERLEPSAFTGLSQLSTLNLNSNNLLLTYKAYAPGVFRPLRKLEVLAMESNRRNEYAKLGKYPDEIFSDLISLQELRIDGLKNVNFGTGFRHLSSLKSLYVVYSITQATLNASTFVVFARMPIETLTVQCKGMRLGTLKHFTFLKTLNIRADGLRRALSTLVDLRGRNLTSLSIVRSNVNRGGGLNPGNLIVTSNMTAHLATMCVKHLDFSGNKIIEVNGDVLFQFKHPECVETFVMNENFMYVANNFYNAVGLYRFRKLKYLDISSTVSVLRKRRSVLSTPRHRQVVTHSQRSQLTIQIPPLLEVLVVKNMGGRNNYVNDFTLANATNLRVLDLAYFGIQYCAFRVSGVQNLVQLNISGFDCSILSPRFFDSFPSLEILIAGHCRLNIGFQTVPNGVTFRSLKQLRQLDLSNNDLTTLHKNLFKPLIALETLILANNKFVNIPQPVLEIDSLRKLDLTFNVISSLSTKEINRLNNFPSSGHGDSFSLSLGHNPFLCTCKTLTFIHWILDTSVSIAENSSLSCSLRNGTLTNIWSYKSEMKNMDVNCVSEFWLTFSVVGSCLFTVAVVLGIFGYRYRWNIKYWILTKCRRGPVYEEVACEQYQFDAFVAYNYRNYQWACIVLRNVLETENNYTLCLHDRDFPVGISIQQSIVDAVNNSRKVILVINRAFLTSDWCEFEIQMAGMRMVRDGRENAIIVIMMEEIPVAEMPRSLLNLWKHITFLLWDNEQADETLFWDRLLEVMARP